MSDNVYAQSRNDNAKVKRVELSVHTKMGPMDSVVPVRELIRTASHWGWDAIAITDHGSVQAFPDAMYAAEYNPFDIKVIYGMEGALTEDHYQHLCANHITILAKNMDGLHNLYRLVSLSHLFFGRCIVSQSDLYSNRYAPRIPRSILKEHREGLLLGSSGAEGELIRAIASCQYEDEELITVARFYDYLEIQPIGNYAYLLRSNEFPHINTEEDLRDINRKVAALAKKLDKLLVATGDVHFLHPEDAICLEVLTANNDSDETIPQPSLFLHTTEEMLKAFEYLGEEAAYEAVVTNSRRIADMIERIKPIPDDLFDSILPNADEEIKTMAYKRAHELYGENLPEIVQNRLDQELTPILKHGFSSLYLIAHKLVKKSNDDGYSVFVRGSVGASFVATIAGITEVNPLAPHWHCTKCHYSEFITDGTYNSGFDLPEKNCPNCGEPLIKDGHDIPFAAFLGYDGDKVPDIDINYSDEERPELCKYIERLFGKDKVYAAGTIETLSEPEVRRYIQKYFDKKGETPSENFIQYIVNRCVGVKKTTGVHSAGIYIVPQEIDVNWVTPVQHPEDRLEFSDVVTTHFDYHSISHCLVKFDIIPHKVPTWLKLLEEYTHRNHRTIPFNDPETLSIFRSTEALGVSPEELGTKIGTFGIPNFCSLNTRQILDETKPTHFSNIVKISGFCHGTEIWENNMQDALRDGVCTLHDAISVRDDIMMYLIHKGIEPSIAFKAMECTRKGKGLKPDVVEQLKTSGVPEWYIEACQKVKYLFPRAHTTSYVMMAYLIAYYKVHYPAAFYAAYFSVYAEVFDADVITVGKEAVKKRISELSAKYPDLEEDSRKLSWERYEELKPFLAKFSALQVALEMLLRGFTIEPINPNHSDTEQCIIFDKYMKPLFVVHCKS